MWSTPSIVPTGSAVPKGPAGRRELPRGRPGEYRRVGRLDSRGRDDRGRDLTGRGDVRVVLDQHRLGVVVRRAVGPVVVLDEQRVVGAVVERVVGVVAAPDVRGDVVLGVAADGDVAGAVVGVDAVSDAADLVVDHVAGLVLAGRQRAAGDAVGVDAAAVAERGHVVVDQ